MHLAKLSSYMLKPLAWLKLKKFRERRRSGRLIPSPYLQLKTRRRGRSRVKVAIECVLMQNSLLCLQGLVTKLNNNITKDDYRPNSSRGSLVCCLYQHGDRFVSKWPPSWSANEELIIKCDLSLVGKGRL